MLSFQAIRHALHTHFLPLVKIHEMYIVDVNDIVADFLTFARNEMPHDMHNPELINISVIQDCYFRRFKSIILIQAALKKYNTYR